MDYLFPDFLKDPAQFKQSGAFWHALCQKILAANGREYDWVPHFGELLETDDLDTFPIYSLTNDPAGKKVTIQQQDPAIHTKWEMTAFINNWDEVDWDPKPPDDLNFLCNLSERSAEVFEKIFNFWIEPDTTRQKMQDLLDEMEL
jgi:hypothetical protein